VSDWKYWNGDTADIRGDSAQGVYVSYRETHLLFCTHAKQSGKCEVGNCKDPADEYLEPSRQDRTSQ
jgi:hypothetical protein